MTGNAKDGPSPWAKRSVENFKYFMSEGGLALVLVLIFGVWAFVSDVFKAVFQFPPDWRPVLRLLLPVVAVSSWSLVRVWMRQRDKIGQRAKRGNPKGSKKKKGAGDKEQTPEPDLTPRRARLSSVLIISGILVFILYFAFSSEYTLMSTEITLTPGSQPSVRLPQPNDDAQNDTREVFVLPFGSLKAFDDAVDVRGGRTYVVDNDKYWLADRLTQADFATRVLVTKLILMVLLNFAVALLVTGTTVLTFLPKRGFGHEDALEAGASHVPSPHG
jgi:hypothetical protein